MVSTYSDSKLSRLAGLIRSPFRAPPSPAPDLDWYVPYNGPIEQPRSSYAFVHDPFERGRSIISPSTTSRSLQGNRDSQSLMTSGSQRASSLHSSKSRGKTQPSFISLDTGGIGQSPIPIAAATQTQTYRHPVPNPVHKEQSPPRDVSALHHSYNPHGMDAFAFPPPQSPSSGARIPQFDLSPTPESRLEHPYSAFVTSQASPTSPAHDPSRRSLSGRPRAATARPDFAGKTPDQDRLQGRNRGEVRFEGQVPSHPPISKSHLAPQNLSQSTRKDPSFSLPSHPYAASPSPKTVSGKPPIPLKSLNVLRKLRTSTSAPNLFDKNASFARQPKAPLKLDSFPTFHPQVHEHPLSLSPESAILAVVDPRPRFVAAITETDNLPPSPYALRRPPFVRYDSEPGVLSKCLPPFAKSKDTFTVPDLPKTADLVSQFVEDNALLTAERAKWASRAENSFGNKRSRSLSNRSLHRQIVRSPSSNAISGATSRGTEESFIVDVGTTHTHISNAPSHQSSLKYIAAAAFGHGHSPKVSIDNSGGTSLGTWSSGAIPPVGVTSQQSHSHTSHSRASSESKSKSGHKQKDSPRGVFEAVVGCVSPSTGETSSEREQAREPSPVLEVKVAVLNPQASDTALAVDQHIGIALSTPPTTPEDQMNHPFAFVPSSAPLKAGPHPASPVAAAFSEYGNNVSKHRLPPQVQAHKLSLSTGSATITLPSIQTPSSAKPLVPSPPPSRKETATSSHPFVGAAVKDTRPPSGSVQASFEAAMMASSSSTTWFGRSDSGATSNLGRLTIMEPSSPVPQDVGDDPESPLSMMPVELPPEAGEHHSPGPRSPSRLGLYLTPVVDNARSLRSVRRQGGVRRSLSLSEFVDALRETEQPLGHRRSSSEHVDRPDTLTPPQNDANSSLASSPRPDALIGELDDLDSFRDLFYRPQRMSGLSADTADSEVRRSATTSAFWGVVSPTLSGDGINMNKIPDQRSIVGDVPQDVTAPPSHSPDDGLLYVGSDSGSVYLGQIDSSLPSILGSPHRYSSTPVIEHSEELEGAEIAQATHAQFARSQSLLLHPPSSHADHSPTFPPATDASSSDGDLRLSRFTNASTERMSNIILDFPTPPETTLVSGITLDSFFPNQTDDFKDIRQSRSHLPSSISESDRSPPRKPQADLS